MEAHLNAMMNKNEAIEMQSQSYHGPMLDKPGQQDASLTEEGQQDESEWGILQHLTPRSVIAGANAIV